MPKPRIVFFSSGEGNLFKATVDFMRAQKELAADIAGLITQNESAGCVTKAKELNVGVHVVPFRKKDYEAYEQLMLKTLDSLEPTVLVLLGFTRQIPEGVVRKYRGKIINSHPSLLPKYGGHGMYGKRVHEEVFKAKEKQSGISVHYVDENYDEGKIISQHGWDISDLKSAAAVESFIKQKEREQFPLALAEFLKKF